MVGVRNRTRRRNRNMARLQKQHPDIDVYKRLHRRRQRRASSPLRPIVMGLVVIYFVTKAWHSYFFPYGGAVIHRPLVRALVDPTDDALRLKHGNTRKLMTKDVAGPETVLLDGKRILVLTEHAELVELLIPRGRNNQHNNQSEFITQTETKVWKDLGVGRPLGGRFSKNDLYIADAALGLTRLTNYQSPKSTVELLANSVTVLVEHENSTVTNKTSPILYCNAVAIGPKTGKVYFTDSSDIAPDRIIKKSPGKNRDSANNTNATRMVWDTMFASKLDLIRGRPSGRLLEYNPATEQVRVLADGIRFANGIAVDPEREEWVVVVETFGTRLLRYNLTVSDNGASNKAKENDKKDSLLRPSEYLQPDVVVAADKVTGYIDNADCAVVDHVPYCFGAILSEFAPIHRLLNAVPASIEYALRHLLLLLPRYMAPKVTPQYTSVVRVNMETGAIDYIADPSGEDIVMVSGVTVHKHELYLGSLVNDYVAVYDLKGHAAYLQQRAAKQPRGADAADEL